MAHLEFGVFSLVFKERRVEREVARAAVVLYLFYYFIKIYCVFCAESRAERNVIERIFGADPLCSESAVKAVPELAHKCERSAEVHYLSFDFTSLSKSGYRLTYNRVEYALRDIRLSRALI